MTARLILFLVLLTIAAGLIAADGVSSRYPVKLYDHTFTPVKMWGVDHGTANELRMLYETSAGTFPQFWQWGSMARVSCRSRERLIPNQKWSHEACVLCWLQVTTATISLGPTVTISGVTVYTLGDGAGYVYEGAAGATPGHGACLTLLPGETERVTLYASMFYEEGNAAATNVTGYCSAPTKTRGRPCRVAGDCTCATDPLCDAAGVCTTGRAAGAYLGFTFTATTASAQVTLMR